MKTEDLVAGDSAKSKRQQENDPSDSEGPVIDINIRNVVSSCNTKCSLNLRKIAKEGTNVMYKRNTGKCNMKLRKPYTTAIIFSSGKITCTGATSEEEAKTATRRFTRKLQNLGFDVKFCDFRIINVFATCILPFQISLLSFTRSYPQQASYEPELNPGITYKIKSLRATVKIFSTGSITLTAPSVANIFSAMEHIFPLVLEFGVYEEDDLDKCQ